jgi:hypothetical protein
LGSGVSEAYYVKLNRALRSKYLPFTVIFSCLVVLSSLQLFAQSFQIETPAIFVQGASVDNIPPIVEIITPFNNTFVNGFVIIYGSATDENLQNVSCYIDTDFVLSWTDNGTFIWEWDTTLEIDGAHTVRIVAIDGVGNHAEQRINVSVDNTPPYLLADKNVSLLQKFNWYDNDNATIHLNTNTFTSSALENVTLYYDSNSDESLWVGCLGFDERGDHIGQTYGFTSIRFSGVLDLTGYLESLANEFISLQYLEPGDNLYYKLFFVGGNENETIHTTIVLHQMKQASSISCMISSSSLQIGSSVSISGAINPLHSGAAVTIWYQHNEAWEILETVTTASDGSYAFSWTPTSIGSYHISSSWEGDAFYNSAVSSSSSLTVYSAHTRQYLLLETIHVNTSNPNPILSNTILEGGVQYRIEVSGKYFFDGVITSHVADAEYSSYDNWVTTTKEYVYPPTGETFLHVLDLLINEQNVEWGDYNSSHEYSFSFIGKGGQVSFVISDWYGQGPYPHPETENNGRVNDNQGVLVVRILAVNKISTTLSCTTSSIEITEGGSITISGAINPALSSKTVTLTYSKPDGSTITRTVTTDSDGSYSDTYNPEAVGSWSVTVSWDGDATHESATSASQTFTITQKSGCLIATATYGSELTPQVQFLRNFRDDRILQTFAGSQFMNVFNSFYYSWSPNVADTIRTYDRVATVMKPSLYPLIGILQVSEEIYSVLSFNPELAVVTTGFVASILISGIYLLPLILLISYFRKQAISRSLVYAIGTIWLASLCAIVLAEFTQSAALMMTATGTFVLATMVATVLSMMIVIPTFLKKHLQS